MRNIPLRRPSPAIIVGIVAVVLASSGGAFAAGTLTGKSIRDSSLTGKDIKNKSLSRSDFRGSVRGADGFDGADGKPGAPGPPGLAGVHNLDGGARNYPPGDYGTPPIAQCPPGEVVIGTGFNGPMGSPAVFVKAYGTFVGGFFVNDSAIAVDGNVQATCARVSAPGAARAARSSSGRRQYERDVQRATASR